MHRLVRGDPPVTGIAVHVFRLEPEPASLLHLCCGGRTEHLGIVCGDGANRIGLTLGAALEFLGCLTGPADDPDGLILGLVAHGCSSGTKACCRELGQQQCLRRLVVFTTSGDQPILGRRTNPDERCCPVESALRRLSIHGLLAEFAFSLVTCGTNVRKLAPHSFQPSRVVKLCHGMPIGCVRPLLSPVHHGPSVEPAAPCVAIGRVMLITPVTDCPIRQSVLTVRADT